MLWSNWDVFSGRTTFTTKFLDQDFGSAYCLAGISIYHELPGDRLNGLCSRVQAFRLWFAWLCHPLVWYLKRLRSWPTVRNNWATARRSKCMKTWSVPLAILQAKTIQTTTQHLQRNVSNLLLDVGHYLVLKNLRSAYILPTRPQWEPTQSSKALAYLAYAREVLCRLCLSDFSLRQIFESGMANITWNPAH